MKRHAFTASQVAALPSHRGPRCTTLHHYDEIGLLRLRSEPHRLPPSESLIDYLVVAIRAHAASHG